MTAAFTGRLNFLRYVIGFMLVVSNMLGPLPCAQAQDLLQVSLDKIKNNKMRGINATLHNKERKAATLTTFGTSYGSRDDFREAVCDAIPEEIDDFRELAIGPYNEAELGGKLNLNIKYENTSPTGIEFRVFENLACATLGNSGLCLGSMYFDLSQATYSNGQGGVHGIFFSYLQSPYSFDGRLYLWVYYTDGTEEAIAMARLSDFSQYYLTANDNKRIKGVAFGKGPPDGPVTTESDQVRSYLEYFGTAGNCPTPAPTKMPTKDPTKKPTMAPVQPTEDFSTFRTCSEQAACMYITTSTLYNSTICGAGVCTKKVCLTLDFSRRECRRAGKLPVFETCTKNKNKDPQRCTKNFKWTSADLVTYAPGGYTTCVVVPGGTPAKFMFHNSKAMNKCGSASTFTRGERSVATCAGNEASASSCMGASADGKECVWTVPTKSNCGK